MNSKINGYANSTDITEKMKNCKLEADSTEMNGHAKTAMDKMDCIPTNGPSKANGIVRRKSRKSIIEEPDELAKLPKIKEQSKLEERMKLALKKMQLCQRICNFNDAEAQINMKEAKRQSLEELLDFLRTLKGAITEKFYAELFTLISVNLFRDLPPREDELCQLDLEFAQTSGPEDESDFGNNPDLAWLHLELIYEIFLHFLGSLEFRATLAKKFVDQDFVLKLLGLFQSEEPREREMLVKILKKIYAKFIRLRIFIKKQICYLLLAFLYEPGQQKFCGISELLDILKSVVDDFRVPLKTDNKELLFKIFLPLHKPNRGFAQYYHKLANRVIQYIQLDPFLTKPVVEALLKYWPSTSGSKELYFLDEVTHILKVTETDHFRAVAKPLFHQIGKCISSSHCQVANRALQLWKEEGRIEKLLRDCNAEITPLVFEPLLLAASGHWNKNVQSLAKDVQNILAERNWKLWNRLLAEREETPV